MHVCLNSSLTGLTFKRLSTLNSLCLLGEFKTLNVWLDQAFDAPFSSKMWLYGNASVSVKNPGVLFLSDFLSLCPIKNIYFPPNCYPWKLGLSYNRVTICHAFARTVLFNTSPRYPVNLVECMVLTCFQNAISSCWYSSYTHAARLLWHMVITARLSKLD